MKPNTYDPPTRLTTECHTNPTRTYKTNSHLPFTRTYVFGYQENQIYSVAALTDSTGNMAERYTYDPYGKAKILAADGITVRTASAVGNPWTFTGRRLDGETGLMYYRARMYSVELGRFLGRDRLGYVDGLNLYCHTRGMPTTLLDPLGTTTTCVFADQTATKATDSWVSEYTGTGTILLAPDLSNITGGYTILPTQDGGSATLNNHYLHDWTAFWGRSSHKVGAKWNRKYKCEKSKNDKGEEICITKYVDGEGPKANPNFKDYFAYAHMSVLIEGEGTSKVHITVTVKTGASAKATIKHGAEINGSVGGHEGSPGGGIKLGTELTIEGDVGLEKGTTKDWWVECKCIDARGGTFLPP